MCVKEFWVGCGNESPGPCPSDVFVRAENRHLFLADKTKVREQGGRGVGGCGVHLSAWIHQEHTFRHRCACGTPAESRQEDLTTRKEYIQPYKTQ